MKSPVPMKDDAPADEMNAEERTSAWVSELISDVSDDGRLDHMEEECRSSEGHGFAPGFVLLTDIPVVTNPRAVDWMSGARAQTLTPNAWTLTQDTVTPFLSTSRLLPVTQYNLMVMVTLSFLTARRWRLVHVPCQEQGIT